MMPYKVVYSNPAIEHIKSIADWYEKHQKGLGARFKTVLKAEIKAIQKIRWPDRSDTMRYDLL